MGLFLEYSTIPTAIFVSAPGMYTPENVKTLVPRNPVHFPCYLRSGRTVVIEIFLHRAPVLHDAAAFLQTITFLSSRPLHNGQRKSIGNAPFFLYMDILPRRNDKILSALLVNIQPCSCRRPWPCKAVCRLPLKAAPHPYNLPASSPCNAEVNRHKAYAVPVHFKGFFRYRCPQLPQGQPRLHVGISYYFVNSSPPYRASMSVLLMFSPSLLANF